MNSFLKWAGGKSQLLEQFEFLFPQELKQGKILNYVEPFVGAGAVFFHVAQKYQIQKACLIDVNKDLILTYQEIRDRIEELIEKLRLLRDQYLSKSLPEREQFFYEVRKQYNEGTVSSLRAAQVIFLNKTCYNGLFRVNKKGLFNAPFGQYQNPAIFDEMNLRQIAQLLKGVTLLCDDFESCEQFVDDRTFVYLDPPYRPLSKTSSFTSYSGTFGDAEQIRLAKFFERISREKEANLMLSNSDPTDHFFDDLYRGFLITRVKANRAINSKASGRGQITELVVRNYG